MILFIVLVTVFLFSFHAEAQTSSSACFDDLLFRWNALALDSNQHIRTFEASTSKHQKMHEKLDREYAAVKALACW